MSAIVRAIAALRLRRKAPRVVSHPTFDGAPATFKISNARRIDRNSLVGAFDLQMPSGLVVRGAMLFASGGRRWVGFPSKEWIGEDGAKRYSPLLEFSSRDVADRFQRLVLPLAEQALGLDAESEKAGATP